MTTKAKTKKINSAGVNAIPGKKSSNAKPQELGEPREPREPRQPDEQLPSKAGKKIAKQEENQLKAAVAQKILPAQKSKSGKLIPPAPKLKAKAEKILIRLTTLYPAPHSDLKAQDAWELMVATILAAQCTDERVNKVTPALFARWPSPKEMAKADPSELEEVIRSTGLFRTKAKNLIENAKLIMTKFAGQVPRTMQDLVSLPGVARKTANIVLWGAFGLNQGMAVDTHVKRIAFRLGLTASTNPEVVEKDLMALFPQASWGDLNHRMVWFGRDVCIARRPQCTSCTLEDLCEKQGVQE